MATDYQRIYSEHADAYDRLVAAEDCDGHLTPALAGLLPLANARVVEVGAGTGRLTRLLVAAGAHVSASDASAAMLTVAERHLRALDASGERWSLARADADALPYRNAAADAAVAGWVFGHQTRWAIDWQASIGACLTEMARVVRPGGVLAVLETLGTGRETPQAPDERLAAYYAWLQSTHGMTRVSLRTDYRFATAQEASETMGFFFGEAFAASVLAAGRSVVPECTGLWWRRT